MIDKVLQSQFIYELIFDNTIAQYIDALVYFIISLIILFVFQKFLLLRFARFAHKTKTEIDDVILEFIESIRPQLYIILAGYIALHSLYMSDMIKNILNVIVIIVIIFQITRSLQIVVEFAAKKLSKSEDDKHTRSATHLLGAMITIVVWIFGIMMILSNIGINITSLVTGVGIGGIAIAFAVQKVLGDLFSSFAIYFDKPFKAGDVVKVGTQVGTVKKIGIKTTRLQTTVGEELIISNQDMTSSRIHNYKQMEHRNVNLEFCISFDTPTEKLRQIPELIKENINKMCDVECQRVHFKKFGEWGLIYSVLYTINSRNFTVYMDAQQQINFGIKDLLERMKIELAYPGQVRNNDRWEVKKYE